MCLAFRSGMFLILNKGKKYNIAVCHDKSMFGISQHWAVKPIQCPMENKGHVHWSCTGGCNKWSNRASRVLKLDTEYLMAFGYPPSLPFPLQAWTESRMKQVARWCQCRSCSFNFTSHIKMICLSPAQFFRSSNPLSLYTQKAFVFCLRGFDHSSPCVMDCKGSCPAAIT